MKLAIVGSTMLAGNVEAQRLIDEAIAKYKPDVIVSGGADGIDTMAEDAAKAMGIATEIHKPTRMKWDGRGGYKERNQAIADSCDRLVRIISSKTTTYGSGWTRDRAKEQGKPTDDYVVEHQQPAYSVVYWAAPRDGFQLVVGEILRVGFWESSKGLMAAFHRDGVSPNVGYSEGDCAFALKRDQVHAVRVIEVGSLSGFARVVEDKYEDK